MASLTETLYVCMASNGVVKVGHSQHPQARITAHAQRIACVGLHVVRQHIQPCAGDAVAAEAALIAKCRAVAQPLASNEWFVGLDFETVSSWVTELAAIRFPAPDVARGRARGRNPAIDDAIAKAGGPTALARVLQQRGHDVKGHATVNQWRIQGVVPGDYCPDIEDLTGVPCEGLRPTTNWWLLRGTSTQQEARP